MRKKEDMVKCSDCNNLRIKKDSKDGFCFHVRHQYIMRKMHINYMAQRQNRFCRYYDEK